MTSFKNLTDNERIRFDITLDCEGMRYLGEITAATLDAALHDTKDPKQIEMIEALLDYPRLIEDALRHDAFGKVNEKNVARLRIRAFDDEIAVEFEPEDPKDAKIRKLELALTQAQDRSVGLDLELQKTQRLCELANMTAAEQGEALAATRRELTAREEAGERIHAEYVKNLEELREVKAFAKRYETELGRLQTALNMAKDEITTLKSGSVSIPTQ